MKLSHENSRPMNVFLCIINKNFVIEIDQSIVFEENEFSHLSLMTKINTRLCKMHFAFHLIVFRSDFT